MKKWIGFILCACLLVVGGQALAAPNLDSQESATNYLRKEWAQIKYLTPAEQKTAQFLELIRQAEALEKKFPEQAALKAWHGTILSTYASFKGGLGALSKLKEARALLETALRLDPKVEKGQAHAILGAIYYKVPAKPLGFRDMKKAQEHLLQALTLDPQSIDANYFYGEYMLKAGDEEAAQQYLLQALEAPLRKDQEIADNGRREEIVNLLNTIREAGA